MLAAAAVASFLTCAAGIPQARAAGNEEVVGVKEWVKVRAKPTHLGRRVEARMDTGAFYSSIDRNLARRIGFDLSRAKTITIRSALGQTRRPIVPAVLQLGQKTIYTEVTVANRSNLSNKVLVGRRDLTGFLVRVDREKLAEPGRISLQPTAETLLTDLPLAAVLVVVLRTVVGVQTFGVFAPVLLAVAFVHTGLVLTFALLLGPLLAAAHLPRVARLAVLVAVVSTLLLSTSFLTGATLVDQSAFAAAFPVVVTATIMERFCDLFEQEGLGHAAKRAAATVLFASTVSQLLTAEPVLWLTYKLSLGLIVAAAVLSAALGSYRGLRLTELVRFRGAAGAQG